VKKIEKRKGVGGGVENLEKYNKTVGKKAFIKRNACNFGRKDNRDSLIRLYSSRRTFIEHF